MKKIHIHSWDSGCGCGDKDYFFSSLTEVKEFLSKKNQDVEKVKKATFHPPFAGRPESTFDISTDLAKALGVRIAKRWMEYDTTFTHLQFFTSRYPIFERGFKSLEEKEAADKAWLKKWNQIKIVNGKRVIC